VYIAGSSSSSVRAIARSIVALEGQSVNLRCIPKPFTTVLRWKLSGKSLLSEKLNYKLGRLNHSLTINSLTTENSGAYICHVAGSDDVNATINLTVKAGLFSCTLCSCVAKFLRMLPRIKFNVTRHTC